MESPPPNGISVFTVVQLSYDFYKTCHGYLLKFPKVERYTLGEAIQNSILHLIKFLLLAANETGRERLSALLNASTELDLLKLLIRLSLDVDAFKQNAYILLQQHLQVIGKELGAWIRSNKKY